MFVTVQQETFLSDLYKTWLLGATGAVGSSVEVTPKHPDINEETKLPTVVLTRVSDEKSVLARNSGFYGYKNASSSQLERLEGYQYQASIQIDVLARSHSELLEIVGKIMGWLADPNGQNLFASGYPLQYQEIGMKHFANATSAGTDTDLKVRYKYTNVVGTQVEAFDDELHQYSITVPFWCDYIKPRNVDKILLVGVTQE